MKSLIEELYTPRECKIIQNFFTEEISLKQNIVEALGTKIFLEKNKILRSKPIDILYIICLQAKFANSVDECSTVALAIHQYFNKPEKVLPRMSEDFGLVFANKTLIALSFHLQALEHRWKHKGAPTPAYYRNISKAVFKTHGQKHISDHHEQWEIFLSEMFV